MHNHFAENPGMAYGVAAFQVYADIGGFFAEFFHAGIFYQINPEFAMQFVMFVWLVVKFS
jgi:hypothetical protein